MAYYLGVFNMATTMSPIKQYKTLTFLNKIEKQFTQASPMPNQTVYGKTGEDTWEVALPVPETFRQVEETFSIQKYLCATFSCFIDTELMGFLVHLTTFLEVFS